ncbi:hypothetical protein V4Y02_23930, partial [Escherichia coli]
CKRMVLPRRTKFGEPCGIGVLIITCLYHQDWVKNSLLRFQETRRFLEAWHPVSMKVILSDSAWGYINRKQTIDIELGTTLL